VSVAIDNAREAVIKALTACGKEYSPEAISKSAAALCAFQKACESEAVAIFAKNFCSNAWAELSAGMSAALPSDEPLLVGHMRSAIAILQAGLDYAREEPRHV
jgi:hypothetical protein